MRALILAALVVAVCHAQTTAPDHCEQYDSCSVCVSNYLCGWCSTPVIYQGNVTGKHCAGYNPNGNDPFECTGIYSIEQCTIGYECDLENYVCKQAGPGKGQTLQMCEANCTNEGQVYLCNHTDLKCYQVPRGTPGSASYSVCEASCSHPSAHPAPPSSPSPAATVYACNETSGQCDPAPAGKGSSKQVCEQTCQKNNPNETKYFCNSVVHTCEVAPDGFPGVPKKECEEKCGSHPNPGPPPQFLGMWRGIQIQNGYKIGEFDLHVDQSTVVMVDIQAASTIKGTPYNVKNGDDVDLWIKITSGPGVGETIKAIGQTDNRGPETNYLLAAFSAAGGAAPSSINGAMTGTGGAAVYFFSQCAGTPECHFIMPSSSLRNQEGGRLLDHIRERHHRGAASTLQKIGDEAGSKVDDPCMAYSANCSYCLSHPFCGWCSEDVQYQNGQKGSQCAGFASNPNSTNPFVCEGRYSTLSCTQGWTCNLDTFQCAQNATAGNGMSKTECEDVCRPTPSPTPQLQQYVCNLTTHQCHKCAGGDHCPGSMPESTCEAACKKPHKGPSTLVIGVWRGLEIQRGYPLVEIEYVFNSSSLAAYKSGILLFDATVTSFGGDEMIFDVQSGDNAGTKFSAQYSIANQGSGMLEMMTLAMSAPNGPVPADFSGPMQTPGETEYVFAKCQDSPCQFNPPSSN